MGDVIAKTKELFPDAELHAVGFSLGANTLLKYLGVSDQKNENHGIKTAVAVSPAFDVLATGIELQYTACGILDAFLLRELTKPFLEKRYAVQTNYDYLKETCNAKSMFHFDGCVRSKILGFKSVHSLWRYISCDRYLPHIKTPFLTVVARDDPITSIRHVPVDTLNRNENCLLTILKQGGHCEYRSKD